MVLVEDENQALPMAPGSASGKCWIRCEIGPGRAQRLQPIDANYGAVWYSTLFTVFAFDLMAAPYR